MPPVDKRAQDAKRLKYVRLLERFVRSVIGYLAKEENTTFGGFKGKVTKQARLLDVASKEELYKEEMVMLEAFVQKLRSAAAEECEDFPRLKEALLYHSNQLEKQKKQRKYKKEKHRGSSRFEEWE
jgi:hypothetical protein